MTSHQENFETSFQNLEKIVGDLEKGNLTLEDSLSKYEQGLQHLKKCYQILDNVESKIVLISRKEDGSFEETPFQESQNNKVTATKKN